MRRSRVHPLLSFEIAPTIEIGNQCSVNRMPPQPLLSERAGSGAVDRNEVRDPAEMSGRFLGRLAHDRHIKLAADCGGDVAEGNAFVADSMILGAGRA